jgi:hypothetical protein
MIRRARLKPEFAAWYHRIRAGEWHHARWLTEVVRRELRREETFPVGARVLSDHHFDFESGERFPFRGRERRTPPPDRA